MLVLVINAPDPSVIPQKQSQIKVKHNETVVVCKMQPLRLKKIAHATEKALQESFIKQGFDNRTHNF